MSHYSGSPVPGADATIHGEKQGKEGREGDRHRRTEKQTEGNRQRGGVKTEGKRRRNRDRERDTAKKIEGKSKECERDM